MPDASKCDLRGGSYLVTAGASGIGRASAMQIAANGGNVLIVDIDEKLGVTAVEEASRYGVKAAFHKADVRDRGAIEEATERAEKELGALRGLVAAAGISIPEPAASLSKTAWDKVIDVSLTGCFITCQVVGRRLISNGGGSIVTISSIDALSGHSARLSYCAAKFGVAGLTKSLAIEWGRRGVRVNSVAPGITDTPAVRRAIPPEQVENVLMDRTPLGRMANPEDIGSVVGWLLSDGSRYVTGQILSVDGGLTAGYFTRWQGADLASNVLLNAGRYAAPRA